MKVERPRAMAPVSLAIPVHPASRHLGLDVLGLALIAMSLVWVRVSAGSSEREAGPATTLLLIVALCYVGGRLIGSVVPAAVPLLISGVAVALLVVNPADVLGDGPLQGPFGYNNATGAFYAQAAFAAAAAGVVLPRLRSLGFLVAAVCAAVPFAIGSLAAGAAVVVLAPLATLARNRSGARGVIALGAALWLAVLGATILLGATHTNTDRDSGLAAVVNDTLSARRPALWHDALVMIEREPLSGVGPQGFEKSSPVALSDRDARWTHNEFLQFGAETGLPGLLLAIGLIAWTLVRLSVSPRHHVAVLGSLALVALAIHACIDYIWHFPIVVAVAAALAGSATAAPRLALRVEPVHPNPPVRPQ
ncbi:MAG: O-antigen ligase family protein [Actinomycetota bacterium]